MYKIKILSKKQNLALPILPLRFGYLLFIAFEIAAFEITHRSPECITNGRVKVRISDQRSLIQLDKGDKQILDSYLHNSNGAKSTDSALEVD